MPNTNNLTNAELTALHTEPVNAARASRTLANITRRAETLLEDGYQIRSYGDDLHVVESPEGNKYVVWHGAAGFHCSCPCFEKLTTCKHLQAVDLMKQDAADGAALDSMEDAGHDAYAYRY